MVAKLAFPSFVAGAKDELATADIYKQVSDEVINSIQEEDFAEIDGDGSLLGMRGGKAMAEAAAEALRTMPAALSDEEAIARIENAASTVSSGLRDMTAGGAKQLLSTIGSGLSSVSKVVATVSGVANQLKSPVSIRDVSAIGGMINNLAGSNAFSLTDQGSLVGSLSGVISTATKMGIPNAFGEVMKYANIASSVATLDKQAITQVVARVIPDVIKNSDLKSLSSIADVASSSALRMLNPSILSDFGRHYSLPQGCRASDYQSTYSDVMTTYQKVDPQWDSYTRATSAGNDSAFNLTALQSVSQDMLKVIEVGAKLAGAGSINSKLQLLAGAFPRGDVASSLRRQYPVTELSIMDSTGRRVLEQQKQKTLDPRLMRDEIPQWFDPTVPAVDENDPGPLLST